MATAEPPQRCGEVKRKADERINSERKGGLVGDDGLRVFDSLELDVDRSCAVSVLHRRADPIILCDKHCSIEQLLHKAQSPRGSGKDSTRRCYRELRGGGRRQLWMSWPCMGSGQASSTVLVPAAENTAGFSSLNPVLVVRPLRAACLAPAVLGAAVAGPDLSACCTHPQQRTKQWGHSILCGGRALAGSAVLGAARLIASILLHTPLRARWCSGWINRRDKLG